jgi:superfamily II DNA helicase RecQ
LWGAEDIARAHQFIAQSDANDSRKSEETRRLNALIAFLETAGCRRVPLLEYFGEPTPKPCGNCDNCLDPPALQDATEAARKLLSAIYRTGQRFGLGHLINVLLGKASEKVTKFRHDQLSVFGIGTELSADGWKSLARQLEAGEAIVRDRSISLVLDEYRYRFLIRQNTQWELMADDPIWREREFTHAPVEITLTPSTNTQSPITILFGREPVNSPFVLTLAQKGQSASVSADGLGNFQVK